MELHYRPSLRSPFLGCAVPHLLLGEVVCCGRRRGPRNALVRLASGFLVVVPRGNLAPAP